jgi:hypothetical protein
MVESEFVKGHGRRVTWHESVSIACENCSGHVGVLTFQLWTCAVDLFIGLEGDPVWMTKFACQSL